jgi:hypothetical protein
MVGVIPEIVFDLGISFGRKMIMKNPLRWMFIIPVIVVLNLSALAVPGGDSDLVFTILPDEPVKGGDTISLTLSEGNPGDIAAIVPGLELGQVPIFHNSLILDLIPRGFHPIGVFPPDGTLTGEIVLKKHLPPPISGLVIYHQCISMEFAPGGGFPFKNWRKSNIDQIEFE